MQQHHTFPITFLYIGRPAPPPCARAAGGRPGGEFYRPMGLGTRGLGTIGDRRVLARS
jgi:hypothetical protein